MHYVYHLISHLPTVSPYFYVCIQITNYKYGVLTFKYKSVCSYIYPEKELNYYFSRKNKDSSR